MDEKEFTISELRERLAKSHDHKQFWRSLDEVANTEAFQKSLAPEFPRQMVTEIAEEASGATRRDFLKLMGAALAMAGLNGCSPQKPRETIVPYVVQPEEIVPGKPLFYATAINLSGYSIGVLAETHEGRPTKLEGNPEHPASLGGSNPFIRGTVLNLYDPERAQVVTREGQINTWDQFLAEVNPRLEQLAAAGGAGLHILTGTVTSPTVGKQMEAIRARMPQAIWHQYDPVNNDNITAGTKLAFGRSVTPVYHFEKAERIVALDADFLFSQAGSIRYGLDFVDGRRVWEQPQMNRLYVVESTPTITGAKADHRLSMRASQIELVARELAKAVAVPEPIAQGAALSDTQLHWVQIVANDLKANAGKSLVIAGATQPAVVHALTHAINQTLGNIGTTVTFVEPIETEPVLEIESLRQLTQAMAAGKVEMLVIANSNPVLGAPADLGFAPALEKVPLSVQLSFYDDETSDLCDWHLPGLHELESWTDSRAYEGTTTILQPMIAPLFDGISIHTLLAVITGDPVTDPYTIVRAYWDAYYAALPSPSQPNDELFWRTSLHDGFVQGTASPVVDLPLQLNNLPAPVTISEGLELNFRPDTTIWDGQFSNNLWLQELPKHLTLLTWDNALLISPATAEQLGVASYDLVEVTFEGRTLNVAVWIMPGHADNAMTITLGYGRTWKEKVSEGIGFNAYLLRTTDAFWFGAGAEVRKTGQQYRLASVQDSNSMQGRDLVREATLERFQAEPNFATEGEPEGKPPTFFPAYPYEGYAWGMEIDLTACIGCNACTIACEVENNIPVVGKAGVLNSREMHWIKVDRYYSGDLDQPETYFEPRPCMHCETAPCEVVCPVAATVHDHEGLNQMVYNRCVGTRYCSNNCPYKVRRFNFFDYTGEHIPLMEMWRNPDVTVRARGVMEKCTYCVQRINQARYEAEKADRPIADGEILTACQQACPTKAIVFGNINDPNSLVAKQKQSSLSYSLLGELGTLPRTTYLAEVRNPNPELEA